MIGLLKKDFFLSKKLFYIYCGLTLLIVALSYTIRFAFDYGNLAKYDSSPYVCDFIFSILPSLIFMVSSTLLTMNPILEVKNSGFINYAISAPISRKDIVLLKIGEVITMCTANGLVMLLLNCVYGAFFGFTNIIPGIYVVILLSFVILIINLTAIPLALRCKTQNLVVGFLLLIYFVPIMVTFVISINIDDKKFETFLVTAVPKYNDFCKNHLGLLFISAIAVSAFVSYIVYLISRRILERRLTA